jgi:hypothetical protein
MYGSLRIQVLKNAFKTIIDNALPVLFKVLMSISTQSTIEQIAKVMANKDKIHRKPYKFRKVDTSDNSLECGELTSPNHNNVFQPDKAETIEDVFSRFELSDGFIKSWSIGSLANEEKYRFLGNDNCRSMLSIVRNI